MLGATRRGGAGPALEPRTHWPALCECGPSRPAAGLCGGRSGLGLDKIFFLPICFSFVLNICTHFAFQCTHFAFYRTHYTFYFSLKLATYDRK